MNEEFLSLQPMVPPKSFDKFPPEGGCSEGLDAFKFFLNKLGRRGAGKQADVDTGKV